VPLLGQRHIDVPHVDIDFVRTGLIREITGDIALTLSVTDQPQPLRPILGHQPFLLEEAESMSAAIVPNRRLGYFGASQIQERPKVPVADRNGSNPAFAHWWRA